MKYIQIRWPRRETVGDEHRVRVNIYPWINAEACDRTYTLTGKGVSLTVGKGVGTGSSTKWGDCEGLRARPVRQTV